MDEKRGKKLDFSLKAETDLDNDNINQVQVDPDDSIIAENDQVLVDYFTARLKEVISCYIPESANSKEYKIDVTQKQCDFNPLNYDDSPFLIDVVYVDTTVTPYKRYKYCADIIMSLKKSLSLREYNYLCAKEYREKYLLFFYLSIVPEQPSVENIMNFVNENNSFEVDSSYTPRDNVFFSCGNITMLSWGKILSTTNDFHTKTQLFPIGLRCLRQEYDEFTSQIIDCFCEIDAIYGNDQLFNDLTEEEQQLLIGSKTPLIPLFRITVDWGPLVGTGSEGGGDNGNERMIKVYEAKSPQQAWQGVMLEQLSAEDENEDISFIDDDGKRYVFLCLFSTLTVSHRPVSPLA
jgi:hypothetical protein